MSVTVKIGQLKVESIIDGIDSYIDFEPDTIIQILGIPEFVERSRSTKIFGDEGFHNEYRVTSAPFYGQLERTGLNKLMVEGGVDYEPLLPLNKSCVELTEEHKTAFDKIYKSYYKKFPHAVAAHKVGQTKADENSDAIFLEWLKYWMEYALKNCETPVIYNSQ